MITYLIVDDEPLIVRDMERMLRELVPSDSSILSCSSPIAALELVSQRSVQVAFLDISMPGMTGTELAQRLQAINETINIIFTTAYDEHMVTAWAMYASGYLLKPVLMTDLKDALEHLRYPVIQDTRKMTVHCFGNFECFYEGEPVNFTRSQSKEFVAFLIDRRGVMVDQDQLRWALWGADKDSDQKKSYIRTIASDIRATFAKLGLNELLLHQRGRYGINTKLIDCDYYRFLEGDEESIRNFGHEYMHQYSWGSSTLSMLEDRYRERMQG